MPLLPPRTSGSRSPRSVRRPDALCLLSSASRRRRASCCAAELVERTEDPKSFCDAHVKLMTRSETLTEDDVNAVAPDLGVSADRSPPDNPAVIHARALVDADKASAAASRAIVAPTFLINGRRYDGPWDESALSDAMLGTLGHRVRSAARDFAIGGPLRAAVSRPPRSWYLSRRSWLPHWCDTALARSPKSAGLRPLQDGAGAARGAFRRART